MSLLQRATPAGLGSALKRQPRSTSVLSTTRGQRKGVIVAFKEDDRLQQLDANRYRRDTDDYRINTTDPYNNDIDNTVADLQERWRGVRDKKTWIALSVGTLLGTYLVSGTLSAIDRLPLLAELFTWVGLVYSAAFFWKFVLFRKGREQLRASWNELYENIRDAVEGTGTGSRGLLNNQDGNDQPSPVSKFIDKLENGRYGADSQQDSPIKAMSKGIDGKQGKTASPATAFRRQVEKTDEDFNEPQTPVSLGKAFPTARLNSPIYWAPSKITDDKPAAPSDSSNTDVWLDAVRGDVEVAVQDDKPAVDSATAAKDANLIGDDARAVFETGRKPHAEVGSSGIHQYAPTSPSQLEAVDTDSIRAAAQKQAEAGSHDTTTQPHPSSHGGVNTTKQQSSTEQSSRGDVRQFAPSSDSHLHTVDINSISNAAHKEAASHTHDTRDSSNSSMVHKRHAPSSLKSHPIDTSLDSRDSNPSAGQQQLRGGAGGGDRQQDAWMAAVRGDDVVTVKTTPGDSGMPPADAALVGDDARAAHEAAAAATGKHTAHSGQHTHPHTDAAARGPQQHRDEAGREKGAAAEAAGGSGQVQGMTSITATSATWPAVLAAMQSHEEYMGPEEDDE